MQYIKETSSNFQVDVSVINSKYAHDLFNHTCAIGCLPQKSTKRSTIKDGIYEIDVEKSYEMTQRNETN